MPNVIKYFPLPEVVNLNSFFEVAYVDNKIYTHGFIRGRAEEITRINIPVFPETGYYYHYVDSQVIIREGAKKVSNILQPGSLYMPEVESSMAGQNITVITRSGLFNTEIVRGVDIPIRTETYPESWMVAHKDMPRLYTALDNAYICEGLHPSLLVQVGEDEWRLKTADDDKIINYAPLFTKELLEATLNSDDTPISNLVTSIDGGSSVHFNVPAGELSEQMYLGHGILCSFESLHSNAYALISVTNKGQEFALLSGTLESGSNLKVDYSRVEIGSAIVYKSIFTPDDDPMKTVGLTSLTKTTREKFAEILIVEVDKLAAVYAAIANNNLSAIINSPAKYLIGSSVRPYQVRYE